MAGPGWRFCIWVQGCSRQCKGCMAKDTWSHTGGVAMDIEDVFDAVIATSDIEGVTFLGGEPFEQSEEVSAIAKKLHSTGLSIVTFTGFTYDELTSADNPAYIRLLEATDLLIDGSFMHDKFDLSRPWVGSSNQRYNFLTDRYNERDIADISNQIEIRIAPNGKTLINGMGDFSKIETLLKQRRK